MRLNYKDRKPLSPEETSQKDIKFAVEKAKLQLAADILATESAISDKKEQIEEIKTTYPLQTVEYVNASAELEGLEDGLSRLQALKKELGL